MDGTRIEDALREVIRRVRKEAREQASAHAPYPGGVSWALEHRVNYDRIVKDVARDFIAAQTLAERVTMDEQRIREIRAGRALSATDVIAMCDLALEALKNRDVVQAADRWERERKEACSQEEADAALAGVDMDAIEREIALRAALDAREGR